MNGVRVECTRNNFKLSKITKIKQIKGMRSGRDTLLWSEYILFWPPTKQNTHAKRHHSRRKRNKSGEEWKNVF